MRKNGSLESAGTVIEMRPDKLSYLKDVQGKLFVRARYMLRPVEGGGVPDSDAFQSQVQVQGGAQADSKVGVLPRRSEKRKKKIQLQNVPSQRRCSKTPRVQEA